MTNKEINKLFRFLKELGIYKAYLKHTEEDEDNDSVKQILRDINIECAITIPFYWQDTIEGDDFWMRVDNIWQHGRQPTKEIKESLYKLIKRYE